MRLSKIALFLKLESTSGLVLFAAAFLAIILCNSPVASSYQYLWRDDITIQIGGFSFAKPLLFWINEGLMALFFLLMGLELKREFIQGELSSLSRVMLPAVAALGGMLVPAMLYYGINIDYPDRLQGWAIPVATDIAFALGTLTLFGQRVPLALKLFLMALAIFDDLGAIVIIAVFHNGSLSLFSLFGAFISTLVLMLFNYCRIRWLWPYVVMGILLWMCVLQSGIHATVAGVVLAFTIPLRLAKGKSKAPLHRLEESLHPWVAYLVMPLFALANAGVSFHHLSWAVFCSPLVLGITVGLFFGKQIGVVSFTWLMVKFKFAVLPRGVTWRHLYAVGVLCGIGFTMSLFLGTLAFQENETITQVKLGVLLGSLLSGIIGGWVLHCVLDKKVTAEAV